MNNAPRDARRGTFDEIVAQLYARLGSGLDTPLLIWRLVLATFRLTRQANGDNDVPVDLAKRIVRLAPVEIDLSELVADGYAVGSSGEHEGKTVGQQ